MHALLGLVFLCVCVYLCVHVVRVFKQDTLLICEEGSDSAPKSAPLLMSLPGPI